MKNPIIYISFLTVNLFLFSCNETIPLDRFALVSRHNVHNNVIDSLSSLTVGNGEFAYTVDATGLQTFPDFYSRGIPLGTMSEWGWHTGLNPESYNLSDVYRTYKVHGRDVDYVHQFKAGDGERKFAATSWLRANPHRIHLGMVGLQLFTKDGKEAAIGNIENNDQSLYLWTGTIESTFTVDGTPVKVLTVCHPDQDMISARIESKMIGEGRLKVKISFPLGTSDPTGYDFNSPEKHITKIISDIPGETIFERSQDSDKYYVKLLHKGGVLKQASKHLYYIEPDSSDSTFEFSCSFSKDMNDKEPVDFDTAHEASRSSWEKFWMGGELSIFQNAAIREHLNSREGLYCHCILQGSSAADRIHLLKRDLPITAGLANSISRCIGGMQFILHSGITVRYLKSR
jgi:hypothetical protein